MDATTHVDSLKSLRASGVLAAHVPERLGGPELPASAIAEITRVLATVDGSLAQIPQSHFVFTRWLLAGEHPEEESLWARRLVDGALVANAQAETDPVVLDKGLISGTKRWSTGSIYADYLAITARRPGEDGQSLAAFVPIDAEGVRIVDDWRGLGQAATGSGTVDLDAVKVERLYDRARALAMPGYGAFAQLLHAAIDVGIMQAAVERVVKAGVATDRLVNHQTGELVQRTWVAAAALQQAAAEVDRLFLSAGDPHRGALAVAAAKSWIAEASVDVTSRIYELLGAASATTTSGVDRYWRDTRTHTLHDKRREKLEILGRAALSGEPPELGTRL
ncbi:acyl-CoA dehydrogenase [Corynebacterium yudongzhengii]|uniref:Acyl-CoA dehydrogenase n=1 Tax=Corynebacterium yudongzhengii TaxID=2080740 RepID=A0A2U1T5S8_9CORY|nr:acyl-CoA dehydrogenase [Corynebacterium yudongzhengii]PWC01356.1 acyl-CoA dehydrogenase [Corynebacterium yudongzhengii]